MTDTATAFHPDVTTPKAAIRGRPQNRQGYNLGYYVLDAPSGIALRGAGCVAKCELERQAMKTDITYDQIWEWDKEHEQYSQAFFHGTKSSVSGMQTIPTPDGPIRCLQVPGGFTLWYDHAAVFVPSAQLWEFEITNRERFNGGPRDGETEPMPN